MFRRLLIANRGEVAARVLRTCRRLGVQVVAVVSEADVGAQWTEDADVVIPIGPARASRSYLDQDALLEVALHHGCAAVHPGWGFLAENDVFAARCEAAGLAFVGPRPREIRRMGDKALARRTMADLGLPVIPGSREPVGDAATALRIADEIGYPVLLKAVAGGGGKGMRNVEQASDLSAAFAEATTEATNAFGDGRMYLERRIVGGRHIEVQLVADRFGRCVHLGERECSLQRRHQKVLEEAPSPGLPAAERARILPLVAEVVGRAGYRGVGTVEMLLDPDGRLWFMEMNTRLQVEHPVTEETTGVDLVEWQLRIAAGEPLPADIPDRRGHAIECRINAEDPADNFKPSPGRITELVWPEGDGVRVDTHLRSGDRIPPNYDSMVAKVITHGRDRSQAITRMRTALKRLRVEGVTTNVPLHQTILAWPPFVEGTYDTTSLERELVPGEGVMARIELHPIGRPLSQLGDTSEVAANRDRTAALDTALAEKVATVHAGWGAEYAARVREKGKWTTWERIDALVDPGTPVYEVGTLVNWGRVFAGSKRGAPGAGVVTVFARIHARWVIVVANDNTVASGAWWPRTPEKIERAQEIARRLRLPVVYLVDCSGLFLPEQSNSFSGATGAGHIFTQNARLAADGVPQIAGVFGDCIAGGGYMPIISDRVVMTEGAYMVIAGAALIKGAKALHLTSLDIGGPEVHVHQSRCADERVPDDATAIRLLREEVARLPGPAVEFYRHGASAEPPRFDPTELGALFPADPRRTYDIEEVIARLVDSSLFHEVLPGIGREMVTGLARISGLWVGLVANRQGIVEEPGIGRRAGGVLYREGIAKISAFARACDEDGIPLVWLQDISGFDIGVEAERLGLLGYGSNLIYTNSTRQTPSFTVLLRKASGAGYYALSGMPYEPVVQLATPFTRLAVMEGRTLAIATFNSKLDDQFEIATDDPAERAAIEKGMTETAARIEADMDPVRAASVMDTDEVVSVAALRGWLECLVESAWQSIGYRRTKNPRIWSVHDLETLAGGATPADPMDAGSDGDALTSPTVGVFTPGVTVGAVLTTGAVLGHLDRAGRRIPIRVPDGSSGAAAEVTATGSWVAFGTPLVRLGAVSADRVLAKGTAPSDAPAGTTVVRADTDGTFYLRSEPGSPPFAPEGASVAASATLGLVEVMKTFTPVRAPVAGGIAKVLAADGAAVTAGQPLFWIA